MTDTSVFLGDTTTQIDFTDGSINSFGINSQKLFGTPINVFAMWSGDANNDGRIQFSGGISDLNVIKDFIITHPSNPFGFLTSTVNGYFDQDINMNGQVKFSGADNDSNVIKDIIITHPGNFLNLPTYTITTQVIEN
jgi:hypothetical protein